MKVVMTGAAGGVGTMTRRHLVGTFEQMIVSDRREITELHDGETFVQADLTDMAAMERLLEGADGIIHLGGQPVEADWEAVHSANIVGLYNTYEAARRQGCTRIVFATTNHVVGYYRRQQTIDHTAMPRPDSRYGVSKAFGEALGRMYADKYGLRVLNIRIGNVDEQPRRRAPALHLGQPARSRPAVPDRAHAPGDPLRDRLRRLSECAHLVGQLATPTASATDHRTRPRTTPSRFTRRAAKTPRTRSPPSSTAARSARSSSRATCAASGEACGSLRQRDALPRSA